MPPCPPYGGRILLPSASWKAAVLLSGVCPSSPPCFGNIERSLRGIALRSPVSGETMSGETTGSCSGPLATCRASGKIGAGLRSIPRMGCSSVAVSPSNAGRGTSSGSGCTDWRNRVGFLRSRKRGKGTSGNSDISADSACTGMDVAAILDRRSGTITTSGEDRRTTGGGASRDAGEDAAIPGCFVGVATVTGLRFAGTGGDATTGAEEGGVVADAACTGRSVNRGTSATGRGVSPEGDGTGAVGNRPPDPGAGPNPIREFRRTFVSPVPSMLVIMLWRICSLSMGCPSSN
jgi:hypothetical protein